MAVVEFSKALSKFGSAKLVLTREKPRSNTVFHIAPWIVLGGKGLRSTDHGRINGTMRDGKRGTDWMTLHE